MASLKYSRQRESIKEFLMTRTDHLRLIPYTISCARFILISVLEPSTAIWLC